MRRDRDQAAAIEARKRQHDRFVIMARSRSAWVTSIPGAPVISFDALPSSPFAEDMADLGFKVTKGEPGERILPVGITERFGRGPGGSLELLTAESTRAAVEVRHHAGITRVLKFTFPL